MMKASIIKKLMIGALTASLVMAPTMGVFASTGGNSGAETKEEKVEKAVSESTSGEVAGIAEVPTTSTVAGSKTTVSGIYLATSVNGSIVSTPAASIAEGYSLGSNEKAYSKFSNMDAKKSPLAAKAIADAAASQGAVVGPAVNIELGKMSAGKYSLLPSDGAPVRISLGIPKNFYEAGKTYAIVCVRPGGVVTILENVSTVDGVIAFDTTGGAGTYAIIKY